ncbi:acetate/propionate family kinase [Haliangium ochraceum]|uniref:Acetate kinase n=1 Tax=Haliangium ochraceum (strain DSM 14365 / JCM 11303 / SMP-2) TaxID=502025 RepID=D0LL95_HALO1|nr:acetate/propionate family kinase [Haliangium ochraceum]ACY18591.1 acetate kinase [Haliangium ochraceum DSM 14365]
MPILVINCGSSSVKYAVIAQSTMKTLHQGTIERVTDTDAAIAEVLEHTGAHRIDAVGHRVAHGGPELNEARLIDDAVLAQIEACVPLAPLHNPANLAGIRAAQKALPEVPHVAVFDTAFHNRMPRRARTYALDPELAAKHGIRRYGFHGPSHSFVAQRAAQHLERELRELRVISLHLGNGASACAIEFGCSVDTSMGMTPLEGLVMGTRAGDIDPGALLALMRAGHSADEIDALLNKNSGLLGLAGDSGDLRDIQQRAAAGDDRARMAIAVFAHRVRKYIGAYAAVLGGIDAIVLTAGIGENSASMRQRILQRLEFLGVVIDEDRNASAKVSDDDPVAEIHAAHSPVAVLVVATNEERMIAQETIQLVEKNHVVSAQQTIPIAVSARHVHLTAETFATLFGPEAELTKLRDLSQPGQFAANECVNLIGPRDRIDHVRILGPFRPADQVEVSRTDEFKLGVDAPVRDSGKTSGSAPITVEGPKGSVRLEEGLICARRHIHMTPEVAERFGLEDKDEVEVAITGGPRDLIFGDVLVRVSDKYALEMHIDTDEANAAELHRGTAGSLVYTPVHEAMADIRKKRTTA